jgi:hypothetical protein
MKLLDKAKAAAEQAAVKAKEGVEEVQTKRELHAAYGELGEKAFDLVEAGELDRAELAPLVEKIKGLRVKLAAAGADETPVSDQPPAMPT